MDFENNIKKYCSAFISEAERYSGKIPYSPDEELLKLKKNIYEKNRKKHYIHFTAGAAVVAVLAIGIATAIPDKTEKGNDFPVSSYTDSEVSEKVVAKSESNKETEHNLLQEDSVPAISTAVPKRVASVNAETDIIYTPVPRITIPPIEKIDETVSSGIIEEQESNPTYILDDKEYYAALPTREPAIIITENEYIPAGSAISAGNAQVSDGGELWSESEYWDYIGKNPLIHLEVPSDMNKNESDGKFILKDENGQIINDQMRFSYSNEDRTRLLNITVSKNAFAQTEDSATFINGVRVSVFDNHMINTAVFDGADIYILAEMYGFSEEELRQVIYSITEGMAL